MLFHLLTAEENVSQSSELRAEVDSIGSDTRLASQRDVASAQQSVPNREGEDVSLSLKSNKNVKLIEQHIF